MASSCGLLALELSHRRDLEEFGPVSYGSLKCCELNLMGHSARNVEDQNANRNVDSEVTDHEVSEEREDYRNYLRGHLCSLLKRKRSYGLVASLI